jgi:S1-C subfamily serine protease
VTENGIAHWKTRGTAYRCAKVGLTISAPVRAQHKPDVIERGKKATALVEVKTAEGAASGSAFCIDNSGLFITNSHVVRGAGENKDDVRLVVDIGLKTQRRIRAKVLRADDGLDLALLKGRRRCRPNGARIG